MARETALGGDAEGLHPPALADPLPELWALPSGSARRTSVVDMLPAVASLGNALRMRALAYDVVTDDRGVRVQEQARLEAEIAEGVLTRLDTQPSLDPDASDALLGTRAAAGFRRRVRECVGGDEDAPLRLLFDDIPVARLIAGYGALRARRGAVPMKGAEVHMADVCSGWQSGGTPLQAIEATGHALVPSLPPAPVLRDLSGAPLPTLDAGWMRRQRRIDVLGPERTEVRAMFRDSWADIDSGVEGVLHEYVVRLEVDATGVVRALQAEPRVLPFSECPGAVLATQRLVGVPLAELGSRVPEELTGVASCTHLNDLLRSIAGVRRFLA